MAVTSGVYRISCNSSTLYFTLTLYYVYEGDYPSVYSSFLSYIYTFILNLSYLILKIASNKTIAYGRYMCTSRLLKWLWLLLAIFCLFTTLLGANLHSPSIAYLVESKFDLTVWYLPFYHLVRPIPDINTDSKPDIYYIISILLSILLYLSYYRNSVYSPQSTQFHLLVTQLHLVTQFTLWLNSRAYKLS